MNLVLFAPHELDSPLPRSDRRVQHVLGVLRRKVGDTFDAGVINGARGKATVTAIEPERVAFTFAETTAASARPPITLLVGLPRPQTARDILRDATTIGVGAVHFVRSERGEASYAQSSLWSSGEWQRHVLAGAEQAFDTRVPEVTHGRRLAEWLGSLPADGSRLALDNYESARPLAAVAVDAPTTLAIGSERGWSPNERDQLRQAGFELVHLGSRVLRTETAVVAALTLIHAKLLPSQG